MKERNTLKEKASKHGDPDLFLEFKTKAKEMKKAVNKEKYSIKINVPATRPGS